MSYYKSLLGAHIAVFFMSITGVLAKVSGFDAWHVTSYRVTLGALVLVPLLVLGKKRPKMPARRVCACLAMGVLLSIHWYTFFLSIELLGVMLGYAMTGVQPILIAVLARVVTGERLETRTLYALLVALLGFVLLGFQANEAPQLLTGIAVSLFSFIVFALLILFNRAYVQHSSSLSVTTFEILGAIPLTLMMTLPNWAPADTTGWFWALLMGLCCTGFAYVLYNNSMKVLSASVAGLLLSLEVVYGVVGGYLIGDTLTGAQALAALLIANILFVDLWGYLRYRLQTRAS